MTSIAAFRHDPVKMVITKGELAPRNWHRQPAVLNFQRLRRFSVPLGRDIDVPISATPAIVEGVGVVIASDDGYVRLYAPDLSRAFWERRMSASIYASLVVDPVGYLVIACDTAGLICAFDLRGALVWSAHAGGTIRATPTLDPQNNLFVTAVFGHQALGLCLKTGKHLFKVDLPRPWHAEIDGLAAERSPYSSPAMDKDGCTVFCAGDHVMKIARDGRTDWCCDIGAEFRASPIIDKSGERVLVADVSGKATLLDLADGQVCAERRLGDMITASGAISKGVFVLGVRSGEVLGLACESLETVWREGFGAPFDHTSFTLTPEGDFAATAACGDVICRDARSGEFLWRSSQMIGLAEQSTRLDITPVFAPCGDMYAAAYDGSFYRFAFPGGSMERD